MEERVVSQLGRKPRGAYKIHRFCPWGYPLVLETHPHLGAISPTLYWLSCPYLVKEVSRMEAGGLVGEYDIRISTDPKFKKTLERAHKSYARRRQRQISKDSGLDKGIIQKLKHSGIGGSERREGIKCLHMHLAHYLATGKNPIGREIWNMLSPWSQKFCPANCPPLPPSKRRPVAVIDAGSNSCRLLIAGLYPATFGEPVICVEDGYLQPIYTETFITEAGRDIPSGREKTAEKVNEYLERISFEGARLIGAVATGVWRTAGSPHEMLNVISGIDEARYAFSGAYNSLSLKGEVTVCDLGGQSMEVITGQDDKISSIKSFDLGFWSVMQRLDLPNNGLAAVDAKRINSLVRETIGDHLIKDEIVLLGGTATTLGGLDLDLERYEGSKVHGHELDLSKGYAGPLPSWAKGRELSIEVGAEILKAFVKIQDKSTALVSDLGLMGGIALNNYRKTLKND